MLSLLLLWIRALLRLFRSRGSLVLENLALRQQLTVLKRRHRRPSLGIFDKIFWVLARRVWSGWKHSLNAILGRVQTLPAVAQGETRHFRRG